jgi:amino acid adenylation domain-containing protein
LTKMLSTQSVVEWLDRSAFEFPERVAVEDLTGRVMRYCELAELSRAVQARVISAGVCPGDMVGVFMRKSIDVPVAFQAILRSGAAYVPTDPLAPAARAAFMLNDCEATAIFVDEELEEGLRSELVKVGRCPPLLVVPAKPKENHTWRIEALTGSSSAGTVTRRPADLAFMLYTSGSTGKPKAVMLTHENVVSFIDWCSEAFAPREQDKFATQAPLHFSLPVFQLYVAWKHGATVVLIDEQTSKSPQLLAPLIEKRGVSVWFSTPTILSMLEQSGQLSSFDLKSLRLVMFAGETFPVANLQRLKAQLPHPRYVHVLGSTETHIIASYEVPSEISAAKTPHVPVGKVCSRFRSRIVDEDDNDVPSGMDGELCLSGPGVTPGYWKSTKETARAFFADSHGEAWYRTGDVVRIQPDGNLVYRGRRDRMVKKRGNRVELAEIEACLYTNGTVKEVAIIAVPDDEMGINIKAFIVLRDQARPSIIELKAHCARSLPLYMIPDTFAFCAGLPRTSTGKIDYPNLRMRSEVPN